MRAYRGLGNHVTHMNESRHTHKWVVAHTWRSHGTHMNESRHTHEGVVAHTWMSRVTHMKESWRTHERVVSHTWVSLVTHMNESCHTSKWYLTKAHFIWLKPIIFDYTYADQRRRQKEADRTIVNLNRSLLQNIGLFCRALLQKRPTISRAVICCNSWFSGLRALLSLF